MLTLSICTNTIKPRNLTTAFSFEGGIKHMEQPLYQEASAEFYRELPVKTCAHCGKEMDEQCESYQTECNECAVIEH